MTHADTQLITLVLLVSLGIAALIGAGVYMWRGDE